MNLNFSNAVVQIPIKKLNTNTSPQTNILSFDTQRLNNSGVVHVL